MSDTPQTYLVKRLPIKHEDILKQLEKNLRPYASIMFIATPPISIIQWRHNYILSVYELVYAEPLGQIKATVDPPDSPTLDKVFYQYELLIEDIESPHRMSYHHHPLKPIGLISGTSLMTYINGETFAFH